VSNERVATSEDLRSVVDAWRAGIDTGADPVRLRMIEAMARRADGLHGDARRILEDRLASLMAAYGQPSTREAHGDPAAAQVVANRGPLSELSQRLGTQAPSHALHQRAPSGETELLRYFQGVWTRLSADRRLTQSLAKVPDKAGPLNSHHLAHRALAAMREASPGYFHQFVAHVDALLALDQMMQAATAPPAPAPAPASTAAPRQRKARSSATK